MLAIAGSKIRVLSLENGKELLKFPNDLEFVQSIWISNDANTIVTHPPAVFECKHGWNEDGGLVILSVSSLGIAYLWNLKTTSAQGYNPTKIMVKTKEARSTCSPISIMAYIDRSLFCQIELSLVRLRVTTHSLL